MSQGAAGNIVGAYFYDRADVFQGDVSGTLDQGPPSGHGHGLLHLAGRHVVQHDDFCTSFQGFPDHVQAFRFHFYFMDEGRVFPGHPNSIGNAPGCCDVIAFQHDPIGEVEAMVLTTADSHRILFKDPIVGGGFSGV